MTYVLSMRDHRTIELPDTKIAISELTHRTDSKYNVPLQEKVRKVNKSLRSFCRSRDWQITPHSGIKEKEVNLGGPHLNAKELKFLPKK